MSRRTGATFVEVSIALILVTVAVAGAAQAVVAIHRQQTLLQRRIVATQEVANVLDEVLAWPGARLTQAELDQLKLDETTAARLPGARLRVSVEPDGEGARRVTAEIHWPIQADRGEPIRLVAWRFEPSAGESAGQPSVPESGATP